MTNTSLKHIFHTINGIRMHVVIAGPQGGTPVVLLHGFPEFWFSWRGQIDALANAGFRLYIPDLRGYNLTDKPEDAKAYGLDTIADDVAALIDLTGQDKGLVVGHDWGGAAAWWLANRNPERIKRFAALNVPHHRAFQNTLQENWGQRIKSTYMVFFQMPTLPEKLLRLRDGNLLAKTAFGADHEAFPPDIIEKYKEAWSQPGALTGMLNWYRGLRKAPPPHLPSPNIQVPVLIIWGKQDPVLKPDMATKSLKYCDNGRLHYIEEASHWVQHEAPEEVNRLLIDWLSD